ncbi:hypothetical protein BJ165DRAFT_1524055 [Panaeolus papilionaceus]|nr:hypothetical protein BJ165DRAFT_1524055 [Panaeolus papilionaceus]
MPRANENANPTTRVTRQTSKPAAKPAAKPVAKPAAKPVTKPAAKPVAKPSAKPIAKPAAEPIAKPAAKSVAKPAAKPVAKPAAKPAKPVKPAAVYSAKKRPLQPIDTNREISPDSESDSDSDTDSESKSSESDGDSSDASRTVQRISRNAMAKKMATKDAQLARLRKKLDRAKAEKKQKKSLIPRPKPLGNLQMAMCLTGGKAERREYLNTRHQVYATLVGLGVDPAKDTFRSFSHLQLARFISVLNDEMPIFSRYEDAWPIPDLIQSIIKNKRHHLARVSREDEAVEIASISNNNDDGTTPSPNTPATPGNNALDNDDDLTLPARAYFSPFSPFPPTTDFEWHELPNYADIHARNAQAQADSDNDADDNEDRVFGGRNTSSYLRRSRSKYAEIEDDDSEDGDVEDEDVEMEGDYDMERGDDADMENEEGEYEGDQDKGEGEYDGEEDEDVDEDKDVDEDEDVDDDEEVTIVIKRKALSTLKDARNKKKIRA